MYFEWKIWTKDGHNLQNQSNFFDFQKKVGEASPNPHLPEGFFSKFLRKKRDLPKAEIRLVIFYQEFGEYLSCNNLINQMLSGFRI